MIKRVLFLALGLMAVLVFDGCSKVTGNPAGKFSSEFKSASPELKAKADVVVAAFKTNGYFATIMTLQEMRASATALSEKQDTAIADMMEYVMGEVNKQAASGNAEATKVLEDLKQMRRR